MPKEAIRLTDLLDLMSEYDNSPERRTTPGYGPFHISYERWLATIYTKKPPFKDLKFQEPCERFILNFWLQFCPEALKEPMDIKRLLTTWYTPKITTVEWWFDKGVW